MQPAPFPAVLSPCNDDRETDSSLPPIRELALVGPQCEERDRIASSCAALRGALAAAYPDLACSMVSVGDRPHGGAGDSWVRYSIRHQNGGAYRGAARFLNVSHAEIVCLHYGSGIYGAGCLGGFLQELRKPLVTVLHSTEAAPSGEEHRAMEMLLQKSARLVTTTQAAREVLRASHHVPLRKIDVIPHGVAEMPVCHPPECKAAAGLEGHRVLLTCGQIEPRKGIEHVIKALPAVIHRFPDVIYVIMGVTEPGILDIQGETYRNHLKQLADELGVSDHILFVNRFVSEEQLNLYMGAADICLTPYDVESRSSSSNLCRMVGMGKAVISTPYAHARELLGDGRGRLVRFASPMAVSSAVIELLGNTVAASSLRQRAWEMGRQMAWPKVARAYMDCFLSAGHQAPPWSAHTVVPPALTAA